MYLVYLKYWTLNLMPLMVLSIALHNPDAKVRMCLVYLKYWTLNLVPLKVYPKVLFHPNLGIKAAQTHTLLDHCP